MRVFNISLRICNVRLKERFHHMGMVPEEVSFKTAAEEGWEKKAKRLNEIKVQRRVILHSFLRLCTDKGADRLICAQALAFAWLPHVHKSLLGD